MSEFLLISCTEDEDDEITFDVSDDGSCVIETEAQMIVLKKEGVTQLRDWCNKYLEENKS